MDDAAHADAFTSSHSSSFDDGTRVFELPAQRDFVGRTAELRQLHEVLSAPSAAGRVAQLIGAPGSGKTWLANEYAARFAAAYPGGVYRLSAGWFERPSAQQFELVRAHAWRKVAAQLGEAASEQEADEIAERVRCMLEEHGARYLWIVDDIPAQQALDSVQRWLAPTRLGATLLISRSEEYAALGPQALIGDLENSVACALLERYKPMATQQQAQAGRQLVAQLGGHALALHLAATRLARSTYDRMLLQLAAPACEAAQITDALADILPHPQLVGIAVSIHRSISRLSPQARHALRLASVLAQAPVPQALLTTALAQRVRSASLHGVSQAQLAVEELFGLALAERDANSDLVLVPLVREAVLRSDSPAELDAARELLVAILAGELPQAGDDARDAAYAAWIPHVLHISRTAAPSAQLIDVNAWLARFEALGALRTCNHRAIALLERGDVAAAQQLLDIELAARRMGLGAEHPQTVAPLDNLGVALSLRGELARARALFEEAIELRRRALGDRHVDLLTPLNNLGVLLWQEGEHAKARVLFEKVVELRRELLGERHPDTLISMRNLAAALRRDRDYVGARSLLEHVVAVRRASLGPHHADTCSAMASLAETLREQSEAILEDFDAEPSEAGTPESSTALPRRAAAQARPVPSGPYLHRPSPVAQRSFHA